MLSVFSRDRDIDFEFIEFDEENKDVNYKTVSYYDIDIYTMLDFKSIKEGTLFLDGTIVDEYNASNEQVEYIRRVLAEYKSKYLDCKERYVSSNIKIVCGGPKGNAFELPNIDQLKEWAYIRSYESLQEFIKGYELAHRKKSWPQKLLSNFSIKAMK